MGLHHEEPSPAVLQEKVRVGLPDAVVNTDIDDELDYAGSKRSLLNLFPDNARLPIPRGVDWRRAQCKSKLLLGMSRDKKDVLQDYEWTKPHTRHACDEYDQCKAASSN